MAVLCRRRRRRLHAAARRRLPPTAAVLPGGWQRPALRLALRSALPLARQPGKWRQALARVRCHS